MLIPQIIGNQNFKSIEKKANLEKLIKTTIIDVFKSVFFEEFSLIKHIEKCNKFNNFFYENGIIKLDFSCSNLDNEKLKYRRFIEKLPLIPSEMLGYFDKKPIEKLLKFRNLSDKFHSSMDRKEFEAIVCFETAKTTIKRTKETGFQKNDFIRQAYTGAVIVSICGIFNAIQGYIVSPSLTFFYKKIINDKLDKNILDFNIDFKLAFVFGLAIALLNKCYYEQMHVDFADKIIKSSQRNKDFLFILKKNLAHLMIKKKTPINLKEKLKSFFSNVYGENLNLSLGISFSPPISKRLKNFISMKK